MLPYEATEPGYVPRSFYVPAWVLNQSLGYKVPNGEGEAVECREDDSDDV